MYKPLIITGIIGLFATLLNGWTAWYFTRKKYNAGVSKDEIDNLKQSISLYKDIVKDYTYQIKNYIKIAENNRVEVFRVKQILHELLEKVCLEESCLKRKCYSEQQVIDILEGTSEKEIINGIKD